MMGTSASAPANDSACRCPSSDSGPSRRGPRRVRAPLCTLRPGRGRSIERAAVKVAQDTATRLGLTTRTWFVAADVAAWKPDEGVFDTVVMNPPFGAQAANRHGDRVFLARAAEAVRGRKGTVWFLAREGT